MRFANSAIYQKIKQNYGRSVLLEKPGGGAGAPIIVHCSHRDIQEKVDAAPAAPGGKPPILPKTYSKFKKNEESAYGDLKTAMESIKDVINKKSDEYGILFGLGIS